MKRLLRTLVILALLVGCVTLESEMESLYEKASKAMSSGGYDRAVQLATDGLQRSLTGKVEVWEWKFRLLLSDIYIRQTLFKEAVAHLQPDPPPGPDFKLTRTLVTLNRARAWAGRDEFGKASSLLDEATRMAESLNDASALSRTSRLKAFFLWRIDGDPEGAFQKYREAYEHARAAENLSLQMEALATLGFFGINFARFEEAIDYFNQALTLSEQLGDRASLARIRCSLGWCHYRLGDLDQARFQLEEGARLAIDSEALGDIEVCVGNIGNIALSEYDYDTALEYFTRALHWAQRLDEKSWKVRWQNDLASVYIERKNWPEAEKWNRMALQECHDVPDRALDCRIQQSRILIGRGDWPAAEMELKSILAVAEKQQDPSHLWRAQAALGRLYRLKSAGRRADEFFRSALETIELTRQKLEGDQWRLSFQRHKTDLLNEYINYLVEGGRHLEALEAVEASRAAELAGSLGLKQQADDQSRSWRDLRRKSRQLDAVLLSFWLTPQESYRWLIHPTDGVQFDKLPPQQELESRVVDFLAILQRGDPFKEGSTIGKELFELLIGPIFPLITTRRIVVAASGGLHNLIFDALPVPGDQPRYWINDINLVKTPSLMLLETEETRDAAPRGLLAIGNPSEDLRAVQKELEALAALFGADSHIIDGDSAVPAAYAQASPEKYSCIHFASHAVADPLSPLFSAILLRSGQQEGRLHAYQIKDLPIQAKVVTISACRGAGARRYHGEGLVGLSWAFLHAGAMNVVASQWDVVDWSTAEIMRLFYDFLTDGQPPAEALRMAKLQIRDFTPRARGKPLHWASFQLYTRTNPFR